MKWLNRISSILLIGLSIRVCFASVKLGIGEYRNPGPGFMPFLTSCILFLLSTAVLIKDFIRVEQGGESLMTWGKLKRPISLVVGLTGYSFLLNLFGYLITTFLLISLMFFIFDPDLKKWWKYFIIGAIATNLSFLIFYTWLRVELPIGIFRIEF